MQRDELAAWLRLTLAPGVGNGAARRLLAAFGLPQRIFAQDEQAWQACVSAAQARALATPAPELDALLERTWQWLQEGRTPAEGQAARAIVTLGDAAYPPALLATEDPPLLLYLLGAPRCVQAPHAFAPAGCLAMVGSRNPTAQGVDHARQFARALRGAGLCIVSGLALGVDAAAHEGALLDAAEPDPATPATIAVVGTGLDRVYPSRNRELAHRIARHGLVVSEYPLGTPPLPANFPKRNRIISGLSQGTLVVFAIPGSVHAPQSRGCHALIRQGAKLVETAQDVLEELRLPPATPVPVAQEQASQAHGDAVLQALGFDPMGLDALGARTGLDAAALQVRLLELELDGQVARLPGGLFQRMGRA
jgi:DNA processing protein